MTAVGRRPSVVVTDAGEAGQKLAARLREAGADVHVLPVITHLPPPDPAPLAAALARLADYSWAAFTSVRAVEAVCRHDAWKEWPWASAARPRVAAVGPVTRSALAARGVPVAIFPDAPGAHALAEAIISVEGGALAGHTIFWPRSNIARPDLANALTAAGADLVSPVAYCTMPSRPANLAEILIAIEAGRIDCVAFLSPSSATALADLMPDGTLSALADRTAVASIGPTTSAELVRLGAPATVEAASRTAGDLAVALIGFFGLTR